MYSVSVPNNNWSILLFNTHSIVNYLMNEWTLGNRFHVALIKHKKTSHNFFVSFSFFSHIAVSFFVYYETTTEVVVSYYTKNKTNKNPCQISASANSSSPRKITYITWPWLTLSDTLQVGHLAASWARGWVTTYIDYFTVTRILP